MAAPSNAIVMRNALVTVETVEYANQVRVARLEPDTPTQTYRTLVPDGAVQDTDSTVWTLVIEGLQINHAGGLAKALRDADGTEIDVILQPKVGTGQPKATFVAIAKAPPFGGEQGQFLTMALELPVVGAVTFGTAS